MSKDDDYDFWDDDFTDWAFHSMLCELERNGKILQQWEMGAPVVNEKEPNQKLKKNYDEKRETI